MTLEDLLDEVSVMQMRDIEKIYRPHVVDEEWFLVEDEDGIIAYTRDETTALYLRLAIINARLNQIARG